MEKEGIALDKELLLYLSADFEKKLKQLTKDIIEMAKEDFNINSPKQLSYILFEKLKLPRIKRTKTGSSTDTEVLRKLSKLHALPFALLEFRELAKLKSTYLDGMLKLLRPETGKVHTLFNQTATATGRLSSSGPNLQNIPIRSELGKKIRQLFISGNESILLLSADYSQIELRILAHLSADKNLTSAFKEDRDIHVYTASLIFGARQDQVTAEMRATAKTVNFGIVYGMGPYSLSKDLGIEQAKAQEFIQAYFQRYPGVKKYIDRVIEQAKTRGFVTTLLNRRRYIPEINSPSENLRQFAQRVAVNTPVQGSASDLIKSAMVAIHQQLSAQRLLSKMLLQVHDELVFAVPREELEQAQTLIKDLMENVIKLKVPVKVSIKTGYNWLEMK
ncbi:MAG: DNA polymerase I, partial [Candidatus Omnitrophica bacterium]|nr:DNA polymerase I [Candidatus Omnitrophota bacterium]